MQKKEEVPNPAGKKEKILGFVEAISEIEGYHTMERQSGGIPGALNTTKHKIEFWTVGFWSIFKTIGISFIIVPLCLGAWHHLVPVYGSNDPNWFDSFMIFLLPLSFCLSYAFFIAKLGNLYEGQYTKIMINRFMWGVATGAAAQAFFALALFHYISLVILQPAQLEHYLLKLQGVAGYDVLNWWYGTLLQWRTAFIHSAWFLTVTSFLYVVIPGSVIMMKVWSDKQKHVLGGRQL